MSEAFDKLQQKVWSVYPDADCGECRDDGYYYAYATIKGVLKSIGKGFPAEATWEDAASKIPDAPPDAKDALIAELQAEISKLSTRIDQLLASETEAVEALAIMREHKGE